MKPNGAKPTQAALSHSGRRRSCSLALSAMIKFLCLVIIGSVGTVGAGVLAPFVGEPVPGLLSGIVLMLTGITLGGLGISK